MNFHIFVLISSILFYIFLRSYKYNILTSKSSLKKSKNRRNKKSSNLIYALFLPIVLYIFYYIFIYKPNYTTHSSPNYISSSHDTRSVFSDNGLTKPYPITASDNNTMSSIF